MYGWTELQCELFVSGQAANQNATERRTNAYQKDVHKKQKQKQQRKTEVQMEEPSPPVYTNTVDDDAGVYEYVRETDLRRAGKPQPTGSNC